VFEGVVVLLFDLSDAKISLVKIPNEDLVADDFLGVERALLFAMTLLNSAALTGEGEDGFWFEWEWLEPVGSVDVLGVADEQKLRLFARRVGVFTKCERGKLAAWFEEWKVDRECRSENVVIISLVAAVD
jgi:hypothetical protein